MTDTDVTIIGAGIVGLATARALVRAGDTPEVTVVDKEPEVARHQTGHNSGVIHSGVYYRPGSRKSRLVAAGREQLAALCAEHDIPIRWCGKLVVARDAEELAGLARIEALARTGGIESRRLARHEIASVEPHVVGHAALSIPSAGVVDYRRVADAMRREVIAGRGRVHLGTAVTELRQGPESIEVVTDGGDRWTSRWVVNCAGLQSDRVAALTGRRSNVSIVPFRGEYHELRPTAGALVRALVYPVPDDRFPFLGVHLTRGIDDIVHAGPNAVLALAREGYGRMSFDRADAAEIVGNPGIRRLARRHWRRGAAELYRSAVERAFHAEVRRLVPEIGRDDIVRSGAGVRAQAIRPDGSLVDDFECVTDRRAVHVINAPSPAATSG